MFELRIEMLTFREADRQRWRNGQDDMLQNSSASAFLKRVIGKKHRIRPNRFFGEALVASRIKHDEGYYSSFKWLTSSAWSNSADLEAEDAAEFRRALAKHFPRLGELQAKARALFEAVGGRRPTAPDLWLVVNGEHRFVEVKLANDDLASHQYAGLALIAKCLPSEKPISVVLANLDCTADQFAHYCGVIDGMNARAGSASPAEGTSTAHPRRKRGR